MVFRMSPPVQAEFGQAEFGQAGAEDFVSVITLLSRVAKALLKASDTVEQE
jgi:hypothetical protein